MLLKLYCVHAKSPKKSHELTNIVSDLQEVFEFPKGGDLPVFICQNSACTFSNPGLNKTHCNGLLSNWFAAESRKRTQTSSTRVLFYINTAP